MNVIVMLPFQLPALGQARASISSVCLLPDYLTSLHVTRSPGLPPSSTEGAQKEMWEGALQEGQSGTNIQNLDFCKKCEEWRKWKGEVPNGCLTDVFDGRLWREWMKYDGVSFLEVPGNLLLMLNIDWFQPFDHTPYSVGVIYLVIQN